VSFLSLTAALAAASGAHAAIWYAKPTATGAGTGTSWSSAMSLQSAINSANPGDSVYVAAGTYRPSVEREPGFVRSKTFALQGGVRYLGGFPASGGSLSQRNPTANPTILSGDLSGNDVGAFTNTSDNSYHVVFLTGDQFNTVIDGFTIRAGNANDTLLFDAGAASDPDGQGVRVTWDFGDGTTAANAVTRHRYAAPGEYTVRVEARDTTGLACGVASDTATVRAYARE